MWIYQLVESTCVWNPYGVRRMARKGEGTPVISFANGPYIMVRFDKPLGGKDGNSGN